MEKNVTIIGAGLVGSLWAVYLSRAGYKVTIYERRSDIRKAEISAGKSINLALSVRGWKALDAVGVGDEVREIAIPMSGRVMHDTSGQLTYQPYGKEGEVLKLDIDPLSHPAWTGETSKMLDSDGQVAKFQKRFQNINFKK